MDTVSITTWLARQARDAREVSYAVEEQAGYLAEIAVRIAAAYRDEKKVILFGNGGSAATAEHFATELTGRFYVQDRAPLPAIALTANTAQLTAIANDYGYEHTFARVLGSVAHNGDIVIGLSTSGRSANVLRGLEAAQRRHAITVGFTGAAGEEMEACCDYLIRIPSTDVARIQEGHDLCGHLVLAAVERLIFEKGVK